MASLAEIRAKLAEAAARKQPRERTNDDSASYPFWDLPDGGTASIRFLPDGNPDNVYFWVERAMIRLPFAGIKGQTDNKEILVSVPCMEMYNETCPVLSEVRAWYKLNDPAMNDLASKYWKKRTYITQGLVVQDGVKEENPPENPIRRFAIGPQLFKLVEAALNDPDLMESPTDYDHGIDFKIVKNVNGKYADYSTSNFGRRERALSDAELDAIDQYGLTNLSNFIPEKPDAIRLEVIKEMFHASVDGEAYDPERWGNYYRPRGMGNPRTPDATATRPVSVTYSTKTEESASLFSNSPEVVTAPVEVAPTVTETVSEPVATTEAPKSTGQSNAQDILAMIRNRQS